ncbi:B12-binding domain-containing radical SAM protein [Hominifimenecus sp. rT4P-3]|uniref:B12-binding domain-containing radical SAM protein n=1 Tax=Hominifimenecus sp. rT4P-3 TaxID=3242979 RepID=UPI003DA66158
MKILLVAINAKYIHSNPAVYSLKACAGAAGESVEIVEYTINHSLDMVRGDLFRRRPDVLAFSCYIWNLSMVEELIFDLRPMLPETDIWLGGPEVSYDAEDVLSRLPVTGVMTGPGESVFAELVQRYQEGLGAPAERILRGEKKSLPLSEIPFWYRDLSGFENRIMYYESSRGCPFSCSYCLSSIEKILDFRSISKVQEELQFFLDRNVPQVKFIDRTFNCRRDHALSIWRFLRDHDNGVTNFHFEIAADLLDEEMLAVLKDMRPGAVQLEIGVQSTNEQTLREIRRHMDFSRVAAVVEEIRSWENIHQHLDLIAGLPYEDYRSFGRSFDQVYALKPEQLQLGFLKVLKGSYMEKKAQEYGILATRKPPYEVLRTRWLSAEEVLRLKEIEAVLEIYYNSGQFLRSLDVLEAYFPSPFAMYEALADYFRENQLFVLPSSRIRKYEILLEFFSTVSRTEEKEFIAALLADCYARENLKSRPSFGPDLTPYREVIRDFWKREAESHALFPHYADCGAKELARALHVEVLEQDDGERQMLVFDYRRRSPFNHNAAILIYPLAKKAGKGEQDGIHV